jgi:hypothetical protein
MRVMGICVIILGLAAIVFGILFIPQATSARQQVADSIAPLPLGQLDSHYDTVSDSYDQLMMAEEPNIQAKTAQPSSMYNYLSAQRSLLGLAKANVGTATMVLIMGVVDILVGLGLVLAGLGILRQAQSTSK